MSDDTQEAAEIRQVLALEERRCRAITDGDLTTLDELLSDDLTHTHVTGRTEDKSTYLANLRDRPRSTTRGDLRVRVYEDVAVMTGVLRNSFLGPDGSVERAGEAHALSVWTRRDSSWQMSAFAASGRPSAP